MFFASGETISEGDVAVLYFAPTDIVHLIVKNGEYYVNRYGCFQHSDIIGKEWGLKISSRNGKGYAYIIKPTPEIWSMILPHSTQVMYSADISLIIGLLEITSGSVVIEIGTGSGSFTHSLARSVMKDGKVYTFERDKSRYESIQKQVVDHKLEHVVYPHCRDVSESGLGLEGVADSIFVDIPSPWEVLKYVKKALKRNKLTRICTFSPCVEQVLETCAELRKQKFRNIEIYETHNFKILVRKTTIKSLKQSMEFSSYDAKIKKNKTEIPENKYADTEIYVTQYQKNHCGHTAYLVFANHFTPNSTPK